MITAEVAVVQGIDVDPAKNLRKVAEFLAGKRELQPLREDPATIFQEQRSYTKTERKPHESK